MCYLMVVQMSKKAAHIEKKMRKFILKVLRHPPFSLTNSRQNVYNSFSAILEAIYANKIYLNKM